MLWLILKYAFLAFIVWILWEKIIRETITWLQLRKQGVVFMGGFPPITDLIKFGTEASKDSTVLPFTETLIKYLGNPLPNLAGMVLMGTTFVFVNKAELLEDFYVKKNMNYSKAWIEIKTFAPMVRSGPFAQRSEDPNYVPQRKILSQAFFK